MKILTRVLGIMFLVGLLAGCQAVGTAVGTAVDKTVAGSGNVQTETREVSGFTAVSLQGFGQVVIDQNGSETLTITADDNFLPYITTEVRGGTLVIATTEKVLFTDVTELSYQISAKALNMVEVAGAGSMDVHNLSTDKWQVKIPGAGSVTVDGQTTTQTVEINGAGNYNGENLSSQETTIHSSGAGMAVVQVSDTLDVTIDGLGGVEYIGNPTVTQKINGVGTVKQRQ
ncbi:MAG: DUF2807 domain-containing protein [Ardenticatenaceae bacterium]|nr:DUF2807 domain-containing protein [Ardenticatenaceae bacterium]MCB8987116.1 DUF2807 domain-containing protein [Ardenticatenaceae bacterium]